MITDQQQKFTQLLTILTVHAKTDYLSLIKELENIIRAYGKDINNLESKIQELKNTRPQKGKDYFTEIEVKEIIKRVAHLVKPKKPDEEKIINEIVKRLPIIEGPPGEPGSPDTPEKIRNKLEMLGEKNRLSALAIKGIEEAIDVSKLKLKLPPPTIVNRYQSGEFRRLSDTPEIIEAGKLLQGSADGQRLEFTDASGIEVETPTGDVNSSNQTFAVSAEPKFVIADGIIYFAGQGYSYSAPDITMDIPPSIFIRAII